MTTKYLCDDCFDPATHIAESAFIAPEYYCDKCLDYPRQQQYKLTRLDEHADTKKGYMALLPEDGNFTEDDLWEAIAESNGVDVSEIMDGDLVEWL